MKWTRIPSLLLVCGALAAVAACVPRIEQPDVRLIGVRVGGLGLQGGLLYVRLGIFNPNRFALQAGGLTYDLDITDPAADGWSDLAAGRFEEEIRVEGNDSTVVEVPVEFRYGGVGGALRSILETGTFRYRVRGEVAVESPLRTEIPYRHQGEVAVMRRE